MRDLKAIFLTLQILGHGGFQSVGRPFADGIRDDWASEAPLTVVSIAGSGDKRVQFTVCGPGSAARGLSAPEKYAAVVTLWSHARVINGLIVKRNGERITSQCTSLTSSGSRGRSRISASSWRSKKCAGIWLRKSTRAFALRRSGAMDYCGGCGLDGTAFRHQGDVNHVTGDTNFIALALNGKRTILTNCDCAYMTRYRGIVRWLLWMFWLKLPVKHVAAVTTLSSQGKAEIIFYTGCPSEKVHVIPIAVPSHFKPALQPFNIERPRILHVGTAANKNLPRLIEAVEGLPCTLVIVGLIADDVRLQLQKGRIVYETYVDLSKPELAHQYELSDLVSFVSLYEGFGMPILEAQVVGRPLLTSDRLPMSDVAGNGACLVDPTDAKSIRTGIEHHQRCRVPQPTDPGADSKTIERFQPEKNR